MAGQLASFGYKIVGKGLLFKLILNNSCLIVDNSEEADLWVLNSCTVKNPAEDHFKNYIDKAKSIGKYLVLAGCVPQGEQKAEYIQVGGLNLSFGDNLIFFK